MKYYTDGFVLGKNGKSKGGGYTIVDEHNKLLARETLHTPGFTNNDGEILGVHAALKMCACLDTVSTDSMVAITWVRSGFSKARPDLNPLLQECRFLYKDKCINLMWEGRDHNLAGRHNEFGTANKG